MKKSNAVSLLIVLAGVIAIGWVSSPTSSISGIYATIGDVMGVLLDATGRSQTNNVNVNGNWYTNGAGHQLMVSNTTTYVWIRNKATGNNVYAQLLDSAGNVAISYYDAAGNERFAYESDADWPFDYTGSAQFRSNVLAHGLVDAMSGITNRGWYVVDGDQTNAGNIVMLDTDITGINFFKAASGTITGELGVQLDTWADDVSITSGVGAGSSHIMLTGHVNSNSTPRPLWNLGHRSGWGYLSLFDPYAGVSDVDIDANPATIDNLVGPLRVAGSMHVGDMTTDTFFGYGPVTVPIPTNGTDAVNKDFLDASIAAAGATNQIYGQLYISNDYVAVTIDDTTTWHPVTNWVDGGSDGVTLTSTGITINADGEYEGICSFSMKRTAGNSDQEIEMAVFVNGVAQPSFSGRRTFTSDAIGMGALSGGGTFNAGDVIELRFRGVSVETPNSEIGIAFANMFAERIQSVTAGTNWGQYKAKSDVDMDGYGFLDLGSTDGANITNVIPNNYYYDGFGIENSHTGVVSQSYTTDTTWVIDVGQTGLYSFVGSMRVKDITFSASPAIMVGRFQFDGDACLTNSLNVGSTYPSRLAGDRFWEIDAVGAHTVRVDVTPLYSSGIHTSFVSDVYMLLERKNR